MLFRSILPLAVIAVLSSAPAAAVDLDKGKEINGTCAACHSEHGQGGKKGEYPRIAGQRVTYLENQLKNFRARTRVNIPMFPYTQERELSNEDIKDIAAYLSSIELPNKMPTYTGNEDALTKLLMADKVMIIPRAEGDLEQGGRLYQKQCAACHAKTGVPDDASIRQAKLAVESRTFPLLVLDPRKGERLRECLSLQGNPAMKDDWYSDPHTGAPVDFITFARTEGRFARHFSADDTPDEHLKTAQLDRLQNWRRLQELAGLR